jgi:hypothetical protein
MQPLSGLGQNLSTTGSAPSLNITNRRLANQKRPVSSNSSQASGPDRLTIISKYKEEKKNCLKTNGVFFVPKLKVVGIDSKPDNQKINDVDDILTMIREIFKDSELTEIQLNSYKESLASFFDEQKASIHNMVFQIKHILEETNDENVKTVLKSVIETPVCFTGQRNTLTQLLESAKMKPRTQVVFERQLNSVIIRVMEKFVRDIVNDINSEVFFGASDNQAVHQTEPVWFWLDKNLGVYDGKYPEDKFNPRTNFGDILIRRSFDRIVGKGSLTFDHWVNAICEEFDKKQSGCDMLTAFLNEIIDVPKLANLYPELLKNLLRVELNDIVDQPSEDSHLILIRNDCDKYYPTKELIESLLLVTLEKKSLLAIENGAVEPGNMSKKSSCLRWKVKESVLEAAHDDENSVVSKIDQLPVEWTHKDLYLFFWIITKKYNTITDKILALSEEKRKQIHERLERSDFIFKAVEDGGEKLIWFLGKLKFSVGSGLPHTYPSLLHKAARRGNVEVIRVLVDLGEDVRGTYLGKTPRDIALSFGHLDAAKVLENCVVYASYIKQTTAALAAISATLTVLSVDMVCGKIVKPALSKCVADDKFNVIVKAYFTIMFITFVAFGVSLLCSDRPSRTGYLGMKSSKNLLFSIFFIGVFPTFKFLINYFPNIEEISKMKKYIANDEKLKEKLRTFEINTSLDPLNELILALMMTYFIRAFAKNSTAIQNAQLLLINIFFLRLVSPFLGAAGVGGGAFLMAVDTFPFHSTESLSYRKEFQKYVEKFADKLLSFVGITHTEKYKAE